MGDRILQWIYIEPDESHLPGDYEELYRDILENRGKGTALAWYWWQVFHALYSFIFDTLFWSVIMFKNYVKTAYRVMMKSKTVSFINIFGLSIGIACCILAFLFVQDELSYDRFHENYDRIVRLEGKLITPTGRTNHSSLTWSDWAENLLNDFPEVLNTVRMTQHGKVVLSNNEIRINENPLYVDPAFLEIFSFPLEKGDNETALDGPSKAIISQSLAEKFFGDTNPMGKTLIIDNKYDFTVAGIFRKIPRQSHLNFDFVASYSSLRPIIGEKRYNRNLVSTYLLLNEAASISVIQEKLPAFTVKMYGEERAEHYTYNLQPMKSMYLDTDFFTSINTNKSDVIYSYFYSLISLLVLVLACINFINLSTARAIKRSKEVAILKVVGATRSKLIRQHLNETVILAVAALIIALLISSSALPYINDFIQKELSLDFTGNALFFIGIISITIMTGILAGIYPAFYISAFPVTNILKLQRSTGSKGSKTRKILLITQFSISMVFLIGTVAVIKQIDYISSKNLGFDQENILMIPVSKDRTLGERFEMIKQEMMKNPDITDMIQCGSTPGMMGDYDWTFICEGVNDGNPFNLYHHEAGENYFSFFNIDILQGRDFQKNDFLDNDVEGVYPRQASFVINESAAEFLGLKNPVGKRFQHVEIHGDKIEPVYEGEIIGLVKDFHTGSLRQTIKPAVFMHPRNWIYYFAIKYRQGREANVVSFIEEKWKEFAPDLIPRHNYLEQNILTHYRNDRRTQKIYYFASIISILIACIGMFGLAAFSTEQRIREIGVRKVFGASVSSIVGLLSSDFMKLILAANVIAWPVAYYVVNRWLQNFAYRIDINPLYFIGSALLLIVVSMLTISSYTIKAANANPVDSLRHE